MNLVELKIPTPDDSASKEALTMVAYAKEFTIESASDSVKAQEARARIVTRRKALDDARKALTRPIDAAKQVIMDFCSPTIAQLDDAKVIFDRKVLAWDAEQDRIRREAQRKEEEKAAAERKRLQGIADEAARKAALEVQAKRRAAEEAAAAGRAEEAAKLAAQAARVEERAAAKVEAFEVRAATVVAAIVPAETARATGVSMRDNWTFEIIDAGKVSPQFLIPDEAKIMKLVKSMKGDAAALVGGIRVYAEKIVASRRA